MSNDTDTPDQEIIQGGCIDEMQAMDADSVHAVVTDPPYGLAFMPGVNEWDEFDSPKDYQDFCEEWAAECRRVLKPGGHLIAFSGNRTYGRLMCGVQDAGFEIRDTLTWHQGQGFPKGQDVSKHIDRYYDAEDEREVVGTYTEPDGTVRANDPGWSSDGSHEGYKRDAHEDYERSVTAPATSEAEQWNGWKTCLKPSTEFAVLARTPMSEDAIYKNVLEHGTGALNIDRTRIPSNGSHKRPFQPGNDERTAYDNPNAGFEPTNADGRYPANLLLGHSPDCDPSGCAEGCAARMLDEQSGYSESSAQPRHNSEGAHNESVYGDASEDGWTTHGHDDSGGASRFFYTAKASKSERSINGQIDNDHPTVKPLDLMEWLVTLVTAPGQRVLDPFAGSGTTIMACRRLGREGIGIEKDAEHADLARKRVELAHELETERVPATEADDTDEPATLESFADADDD